MLKKLRENREVVFEIIAIVLIVLFAVSLAPKSLQNDTFYTVTIGKYISENGIDFKDHYSWHEGLPYTYPHWAYDFVMYQIYNLGGWQAIYISTCVMAAILGICIYEVNSRISKNKFISFFVTIGSLYLLQSYIAARAQLATFILFILLVYNIEKVLENKKIINAIAILIIQILIANLHVAAWPFTFVLYLPYIGEYIICELVEISLYHKVKVYRLKRKIKKINMKIAKDGNNEELEKKKAIIENKLNEINTRVERIKAKREENLKNPYKIRLEKNTNARFLIIILIISILTGFATPLGTTPFTYTYLTLKGNTMQHINEHLPMTLVENAKILCTIIIFLGILTFTKVKIKLSDLFMICGIGYLMLASRRQSSMFALICTIALTRLVTELIKIYTGKEGKELAKTWANGFVIFVTSAIVIMMSVNNVYAKRNDSYISKQSYPVEAAEWICDNLDIKNIRLYNEYNYGSYLLYKGIPVFVDSRADLYAPEFNTKTGDPEDGIDIFSDFIDSSNIGKYYGSIFEKYNITHVLIKENSKINMLIKKADSEKYNLIYSDKYFVIYEVVEY